MQPHDINQYIAERLGKLSPASINRQLAFLKKVFSDCVLDGLVSTNAVKMVRMLTENNARTRLLTAEEERRLVDAIPRHYRAAVVFALTPDSDKPSSRVDVLDRVPIEVW